MTDFGDDAGADDAYSAEGTADPDQVAYRLHELRAYVDALSGSMYAPNFEVLSTDEQTIARSVGMVIVHWLLTVDPDDPEQAAINLHNVRRYWSGNTLPAWDDLPQDERDMGVALLKAIIDWLHREGSV